MGRIVAVLSVSMWMLSSVAYAEKTPSELAREHYSEGTKLFDLTHYAEAIVEFEAAYRAKPDPAFLYNIAQAHRLAGNLEKAITFYRIFLKKMPDTGLTKEINERIAELEKTVAAQKGQGAPPAPMAAAPATIVVTPVAPVAPVAPPAATGSEGGGGGRTLRLAGIGGLAVGGAALAAGIVFGALADGKASDIKAEIAAKMPFDPTLDSARKSDQTLQIVSLVAGGVFVAGGAALYLVGMRADRAPQVSFVPTAHGAALAIVGSF